MSVHKLCIWIIVVLTSIIGIFDSTYKIFMPIIASCFLLNLIINIVEKKKVKINIAYLALTIVLIIGTSLRENKQIVYVMLYFLSISSYYIVANIDMNENMLKKISIYFTIISVPTIIFNGFLNPNLIFGHAFAGRLLPAFYIIYSVIASKLCENKKTKILIYIVIILNCVGLFWSKSRTAIISIIFLFIIYFIINRKSFNINSLKIKKILKVIFIVIILIQLLIPNIYVFLYDNIQESLDELSLNITSKKFFTGRQFLWKDFDESIKENLLWGTGNINYIGKEDSAHNELLEKTYFWGLTQTILLIIYLYSIIKKAINNITTKEELFLILSYFSIVIVSTFETFLYKMHYTIFPAILLGYLIGKKKETQKNDKSIN